MSGAVINFIIQLIAGALGGNVIGSELKNVDLGTIGNSIVGAIGGTFLTSLIPLLVADTVDIGSIVGQAVGGGVSGSIVAPSARRRRLWRDPHGDRRAHQERDGGPNRALGTFSASEAMARCSPTGPRSTDD
jgi:hypothetical protein